jgi:hypothetical protein
LITEYWGLYGEEKSDRTPKTAAIFVLWKLSEKMGIEKADETFGWLLQRVKMKAIPGGKTKESSPSLKSTFTP